jgi:hypothetical protein
VRQPIKIEISPAVRESQQEGRRQEAEGRRQPTEPVKPIVINNLNVTNDMKVQVANSKEGKSEVENNFLGTFEGIARLIKERY